MKETNIGVQVMIMDIFIASPGYNSYNLALWDDVAILKISNIVLCILKIVLKI